MKVLRALLRGRRLLFYLIVVAAIIAALSRSHFSYVLGVLIFIVALLVSVILHEAGHFFTAKKFGMKATQFFVGFGPTIWSTTRGETEYGLKAAPLGAFVRITGMTTMDEVDPADEPRAMRNQPRWQRAIVMVAGSFMHFALAFVLLIFLGLAIGQVNQNATTIGQVSSCLAVNVKALDSGSCAGSRGTSPARLAGLRAGDQIVAVGGQRVSTWIQAGNAIKALPAGTPATLTVLRGGRQLTLHVTPATVPGRKGSYLGIVQAVVFKRLGPASAVAYAGSSFGQVLVGSAQAAGSLPSEVPHLFEHNQKNQGQGVSSVVGVAQVAGEAVEYGGAWQFTVWDLLQIIISVNIFIGAFNLLPLLPLDGGHLAMLGYEQVRAWLARLRGRADPGVADLQPLIPVSTMVFVLLVGLGVLLMLANLLNPIHLIQ